jgi:hypothetical protein
MTFVSMKSRFSERSHAHSITGGKVERVLAGDGIENPSEFAIVYLDRTAIATTASRESMETSQNLLLAGALMLGV